MHIVKLYVSFCAFALSVCDCDATPPSLNKHDRKLVGGMSKKSDAPSSAPSEGMPSDIPSSQPSLSLMPTCEDGSTKSGKGSCRVSKESSKTSDGVGKSGNGTKSPGGDVRRRPIGGMSKKSDTPSLAPSEGMPSDIPSSQPSLSLMPTCEDGSTKSGKGSCRSGKAKSLAGHLQS
jgi:hypothetical protein